MRNMSVYLKMSIYTCVIKMKYYTMKIYESGEKKEIAKLTFAEFLLEIRIAAAFLIEIKTIADENSGDADGNADRSFGYHGHSNIEIQILW